MLYAVRENRIQRLDRNSGDIHHCYCYRYRCCFQAIIISPRNVSHPLSTKISIFSLPICGSMNERQSFHGSFPLLHNLCWISYCYKIHVCSDILHFLIFGSNICFFNPRTTIMCCSRISRRSTMISHLTVPCYPFYNFLTKSPRIIYRLLHTASMQTFCIVPILVSTALLLWFR